MVTAQKTRTLDEMTLGEPYYVVLIHKKGAMPEFLSDSHAHGPALFDSMSEARLVATQAVAASNSNLKAGWKFKIVRLKD